MRVLGISNWLGLAAGLAGQTGALGKRLHSARSSARSPGVADLVITGVRAELPRGLRLIWRTADKEGEARP